MNRLETQQQVTQCGGGAATALRAHCDTVVVAAMRWGREGRSGRGWETRPRPD